MYRAIIAAMLTVWLLGCGMGSDVEPAPTPEPDMVSITTPKVTITQDGGFEVELNCPWMLSTFYDGHEWDMDIALENVRAELRSILPANFADFFDVAFSRETIIERLMVCEWQAQISPDVQKRLEAELDEYRREQDAEFQRQLEQWESRSGQGNTN